MTISFNFFDGLLKKAARYMNSDKANESSILWDKFREGDTNALGALMRKYYRDLFTYGTRFTTNAELVKDCIQDIFLLLWKNRSTVNKTDFVKFYLLKSLRRKLSKSLCNNTHTHVFVNNGLNSDAGFDESVDAKIIRLESYLDLSKRIRKILATLSHREQEVIYLRFYACVDYSEIAEILSIEKQSAYNLLHGALTKLKKHTSEVNVNSNGFF